MEKMIQIMPAPSGLLAYLSNGDKTATPFPVVGLALLEDSADGSRYVDYLVAVGDEIEPAGSIPSFVAVEHPKRKR